VRARLRHTQLALAVGPVLLLDARRRTLYGQMAAFCRSLPAILNAPLPQALKTVTPEGVDLPVAFDTIRDLADLAALLDRRSPLGVCLRRSLTRYHFLRRAGLPVCLQFGARFRAGKPGRLPPSGRQGDAITGHAWLTLNGTPYYESSDDWEGFAVMLTFPTANEGT
jgi:hypothetical protein